MKHNTKNIFQNLMNMKIWKIIKKKIYPPAKVATIYRNPDSKVFASRMRRKYWKVGKFEQFYNRLWHESHKFSHCDTVVFVVGFGEVGVAFRIALQPQIGCCAFATLCRLAFARRTGICVCLLFAPLFSIRLFLASDMQTPA